MIVAGVRTVGAMVAGVVVVGIPGLFTPALMGIEDGTAQRAGAVWQPAASGMGPRPAGRAVRPTAAR